MKRVYLTNIEYDCLFRLGGDGLIAVFGTIRAKKKGVVIRKVGKKGLIANLQLVTGLSRTILEKHLPILLEIGLIEEHSNGCIAVHGRNWSRKNLPMLTNRKNIPIAIYTKFSQTKTYSAFVRVHSNLEKQQSQIRKKGEQIEVLRERELDRTKTLESKKLSDRLLKKGQTIKSISDNCLNTTISNLGFFKLHKAIEMVSNQSKKVGADFKLKLINMDLISQNRDVRFVGKDKSPENLQRLRSEMPYGGFFYGSKGIYYEGTPRIVLGISPLVGNKKKQVK